MRIIRAFYILFFIITMVACKKKPVDNVITPPPPPDCSIDFTDTFQRSHSDYRVVDFTFTSLLSTSNVKKLMWYFGDGDSLVVDGTDASHTYPAITHTYTAICKVTSNCDSVIIRSLQINICDTCYAVQGHLDTMAYDYKITNIYNHISCPPFLQDYIYSSFGANYNLSSDGIYLDGGKRLDGTPSSFDYADFTLRIHKPGLPVGAFPPVGTYSTATSNGQGNMLISLGPDLYFGLEVRSLGGTKINVTRSDSLFEGNFTSVQMDSLLFDKPLRCDILNGYFRAHRYKYYYP